MTRSTPSALAMLPSVGYAWRDRVEQIQRQVRVLKRWAGPHRIDRRDRMTNHYLSREIVHAWSEEIGADMERQASLHRLLKSQRRLSRFIEDAGQLEPSSGGVHVPDGVIAALFDRAGGRMKSATGIGRAAERRADAVSELLLLDDDLPPAREPSIGAPSRTSG